ncbi:TBC1 domain family member 7-like isoform X2 [Xenia sp. Carnegie-2017]|uniref:TBC1 domain family member 7-like isoform X2 n=1 Tax=Xenia sp. Carnegie-2017 TaxID=2897299 RepID=UPI001F037A29|nr:TBC1 domain family member 7-like isoform X2 [Xenia sp. Carnegie-2017]
MSNALEKKGNVRNFRSLYYENLGLRGVEQRKALELLLKDDEIGVLPPYQQIHEFVQQQQKEQVEHLLHTLKVINQLHETNDNFKDNVPMHIVQMYLLNEGEMGFMQPSETLEGEMKVLMSIGKLMSGIFENVVDSLLVSTKFFKLRQKHASHLNALTEMFEQRISTEDPEVWWHLKTMGVSKLLPCQRWFSSFFAEDLQDPSIERIWDKIVAGSCTILAYVAVAILLVFRQVILTKKSSENVLHFLSQIPQDRCETIVGEAIDLHIKHGFAMNSLYNVKDSNNTGTRSNAAVQTT